MIVVVARTRTTQYVTDNSDSLPADILAGTWAEGEWPAEWSPVVAEAIAACEREGLRVNYQVGGTFYETSDHA